MNISFKSIGIIAGVAFIVSLVVVWFAPYIFAPMSSLDRGFGGMCNVALIEAHGPLYTYGTSDASGFPPPMSEEDEFVDEEFGFVEAISGNITMAIEDADADPSVAAIVLSVDSPGGMPVAGEEIAEALKHAEKPTVALIRQEGASAGYIAASGADTIFAHRQSDVGGIGTTMSYYDTTKKDAEEGYKYVPLFTGKYKEILNPSDPLTNDERKVLESYLQEGHEDFIAQVAENRHLPVEKVRELADGMVMLGADAKEAGLIDKIGSIYDVRAYAAEIIGGTTGAMNAKDILPCVY